ncbi:MAG: DNA polymerase IV [Lachnospiraceae bacterium]|nr:DNA polymerase IV [Lachnospiraceae bacterium]
MDSIIFHIDVNSAYLSWTAVKLLSEGFPTDIRTTLSAIGGDKATRHGIILAKSIPAKSYHITTGEPVVSALKKCPELTLYPPDHSYYSQCSERLMKHLSSYTPELEQLSIDECFLNFTSIQNQYTSPEEAAHIIKDSIRDTFGFTVNIGISTNKVLAKMASDFKKPDLVHTLYPSEIRQKMWPLPVSELYMAGKSSVRTLYNLGITTIGELAQAPLELICLHLKSHGRLLWQYANGIDDSPFISEPVKEKGIGNSTTLSTDATTRESAAHVLLTLSESVARRLRAAGFQASMVSVELKYNDFNRVSHQMQLSTPTDNSTALYQTSLRLFDNLWNGTPIRLLGIRTAKLTTNDEPVQLSLFDQTDKRSQKLKKVDEAMDSIRRKYGKDAVTRASFLPPKE